MRSVFGWDLPPGVSLADIERAAGGDEPVQPRCGACSGFLSFTPDRIVKDEDYTDCDGVADPEYGITLCGDAGSHPAHRQLEAVWTEEYRTCKRCGAQTKDVLV